jgi:cysteinyl-tRNA synthetase
MDDDFNTPLAIAVLFELAREINRVRGKDIKQASALGGLLKSLGAILGLLQRDPNDFLQGRKAIVSLAEAITVSDSLEVKVKYGEESIKRLIEERENARKNKNWAESDRIRDELKAQGVVLEDGPQGTTWRRE